MGPLGPRGAGGVSRILFAGRRLVWSFLLLIFHPGSLLQMSILFHLKSSQLSLQLPWLQYTFWRRPKLQIYKKLKSCQIYKKLKSAPTSTLGSISSMDGG